MKTKASVANHPIHPMIVPLPYGLWVFSLFCDLMYLGQRTEAWSITAYYTMAGGIVGAVLAALPGLLDLVNLPASRAKQLAIWHMALNLAIVVLYLFNFFWRSNAGTGTGSINLALLGVLLLSASAWLGRELVFVHGVAVQPDRADLLQD